MIDTAVCQTGVPARATPHVTLRRATSADAAMLLAWRNDPLARAMSLQTREVLPDEHMAWLERVLADVNAGLFVAMDGDRPVATGRYSIDRLAQPVLAELSLTVAPEVRGQGYARAIIEALMREAERAGARRAIALVRGENTRSLRAFLRAGFRPTLPVVALERALDGPEDATHVPRKRSVLK